MKDHSSTIATTLIAYLIGALFVYWGCTNHGVLRITIGALVIIGFSKDAIDSYQYVEELKRWRKENEGRLIFFFPTSKRIQEEILQKIIPILPPDCLKVYYDGPSLVGDIKRSIVKELMSQCKLIKVNSPSIFKVAKDNIQLESLTELLLIERGEIDLNEVKNKIDKIASA